MAFSWHTGGVIDTYERSKELRSVTTGWNIKDFGGRRKTEVIDGIVYSRVLSKYLCGFGGRGGAT